MDVETKQLAVENHNFLNNHPALSVGIDYDIFLSSPFSMNPICKNGEVKYSKDSPVMVYIDREDINWEYYKKPDTELDHYNGYYIAYEHRYGEPGKCVGLEYSMELGFYVFNGDIKSQKDEYDRNKWQCFSGPCVTGSTFEEMINNAAVKVRECYGNFNYESFLTPEEVKNHAEEDLFNMIPCEDANRKHGSSELVINPKYIDVTNGELNRRWLVWFTNTPYCKEKWDMPIDRFLSI